ncbi:MAG TPA: hypothetical protein VEX60_05735, partial [Pyrinomonadaceae bacterium]|nr:hypothetical protein [Pyrinomonadaceae bacterium]
MSEKSGASAKRGGGISSFPTVRRADLERLLALQSPDPHAILGAHHTQHGVVVRAFRPDAERVEVIVEGESPREMSKAHAA